MSTPCEEIRPELEALLSQMTERTLDPEGRRRLSAILRDHPDARQFYLDYCQMHALLHSAHGALQALQPPSRSRLWIGAAAAAALLVAGLILRAPRPIVREVAATGEAWILRSGRRIPLERPRAGDRLVTGIGARSDLTLADGSRIELRERTETELLDGRVDLREGVLRLTVAPRPPGRPLVVSTPHAEATVLGTSFELSASGGETRLRTLAGRVRLAAGGQSVEAGPGEEAAADARGIVRWIPVCDLDFPKLAALPATMETVFCPSKILHTPERKVDPAPRQARLGPAGLVLDPRPEGIHGLVVARWKEEVGDDVVLEGDIVGGQRWSLGFSVSGDSFEGFRVIFAVLGYPEGISVDTIHPVDCVVLASDPRPISPEKDRVLRVEKRGPRLRVWVDGQPRIDTELAHPLPEGRRRTFAVSNFGAPPVIRGLRAWKAAAR
jgi:ferric-dicitrate binding protein FerR (iron transport regulator)